MRASSNAPASDAPVLEWSVSRWFNTDIELSLASFRGRIVALEAFQMLCPGCVTDGLPQAARIRETFSSDEVAVVGLHTVFEHHDVMSPAALEAFLHEYRVTFPVGVDAAGESSVPVTMQRFELRGTPSLLLFDRAGRLRARHFGHVSDLRVGAEIAHLLAEPGESLHAPTAESATASRGSGAAPCDSEGCEPRIPDR